MALDWNNIIGGGAAAIGAGMNKNPADAASPYLNQIGPQTGALYQPYINSGMRAKKTLMQQFQELINHPDFKMNQIGQGYQQSPGYQYRVDQSTRAANQAAAAGGMAGSPEEQKWLADTVGNQAGEDYWKYLTGGLGEYNKGLEGFGHINDTGFNASTNQANSLQSMLESLASNASSGANNQNQSNNGIIGGIADVLKGFLSGGAAGGAMNGIGQLVNGFGSH